MYQAKKDVQEHMPKKLDKGNAKIFTVPQRHIAGVTNGLWLLMAWASPISLFFFNDKLDRSDIGLSHKAVLNSHLNNIGIWKVISLILIWSSTYVTPQTLQSGAPNRGHPT